MVFPNDLGATRETPRASRAGSVARDGGAHLWERRQPADLSRLNAEPTNGASRSDRPRQREVVGDARGTDQGARSESAVVRKQSPRPWSFKHIAPLASLHISTRPTTESEEPKLIGPNATTLFPLVWIVECARIKSAVVGFRIGSLVVVRESRAIFIVTDLDATRDSGNKQVPLFARDDKVSLGTTRFARDDKVSLGTTSFPSLLRAAILRSLHPPQLAEPNHE